MVWNVAIVT